MRVAVASHSVVVADGARWRTKNRVAEIVDALVECGHVTTVLSVAASEADFATRAIAAAARVEPIKGGLRGIVHAVRVARAADAVVVFMPTVRTAVVAAAVGRRAVVYFGNAFAAMPEQPRWRRWLERVAVRRAGHVIVVAESIEDAVRRDARSLELCMPLVAQDVVAAMRGIPAPRSARTGPLKVLFVGTVAVRKGIAELLAAARALPDVEFRIVGPVLDTAAEELVLLRTANVELRPYADWDELRAAYGWADVLALPSHMEGFPRVAYEATAYGAALVMTAVGSVPRRLRHGADALVVPIGDAAALTEALRACRDDPTLAPLLAAAAHRRLTVWFRDDNPGRQFDRALAAVARAAASPRSGGRVEAVR